MKGERSGQSWMDVATDTRQIRSMRGEEGNKGGGGRRDIIYCWLSEMDGGQRTHPDGSPMRGKRREEGEGGERR